MGRDERTPRQGSRPTEGQAHGPPPVPEFQSRDAFGRLFRTLHPRLVAYARGLTPDVDAADDAVQDVFMKLWQRRNEIEVRVSLRALIYRMVHNRILNMNRYGQRMASDGADLLASMPDEHRTGAEFEAEDLRRVLETAIRRLPPRRAQAFRLSRYHRLQHAEIADIMEVSVRTVDTHILLALRTLRNVLDAASNGPPTAGDLEAKPVRRATNR